MNAPTQTVATAYQWAFFRPATHDARAGFGLEPSGTRRLYHTRVASEGMSARDRDLELELGAEVACSDGQVGEVVALVADPVARTVTHLAVEQEHHPRGARLVAFDLVAAAVPGSVELSCTVDEFGRLAPFHDVEFVPYVPDPGDIGATLAWPYVALPDRVMPVVVDRVPSGEVEVRRGSRVHAKDGAIGCVDGLVVDRERNVTHVLLEVGHLWGKREVAIPIAAVEQVEADGIHVRLTKDEVAALPELGVSAAGPPDSA